MPRLTVARYSLGKTNIYAYNTRGNVTAITNALNQLTLYAYDDLNNKTNEIIGGVQTNTYVFDTDSFLLQSVIGGLMTNGFTYNQYGQVLTGTDGRGNVTTNNYDNNTGNLTNVVTALSTNSSTFDSLARLSSTVDPLGNFTTNLYDNIGNLTNVTVRDAANTMLSKASYAYDSNGNRLTNSVQRTPASGSAVNDVTTYVYDAQNRHTQTIEPDGKTTIVVYNEIGKQTQTIDKLGHTTSYFYDARGNLTNVTYPDTNFVRYVYDAEARRTNAVDQASRTNTFIYDALGRLTTTIFADNVSSNVTAYDTAGRVFQAIDPRGTTTGFNYDAAGRLMAVTNAVGITGLQTVTTYAFDPAGNQINMVDNLNRTNSYFYDALNRRTNVTFQDNSKIITQFDAIGQRVAETDQATNTTKFVYDGLGRLTFVTNALSKVTKYQFDEVGNLTNQVDALNHTNRFEYDSMGRRIKHWLPMGSLSESFGYDAAGNLLIYTNFNNLVLTNQYDVMNRPWKKWKDSTLLETYTYDQTGQLTNRVDTSGAYTWVFDKRGRMTTNSTPVGVLYYQYDLNGNLTNLASTTSSGTLLTYLYDARNRLTNVVDSRLTGMSVTNTSYTFDGVGNLQAYKYPNGVTNLYQYDSLNRLTNIVWKTNGVTYSSYAYSLAPTGNRTQLIELLNATNRTNQWTYDQTYRLTNEVINGGSVTGSLSYTYDDAGNRLSRGGSGNVTNTVTPKTYAYDSNDRISPGESYDNNGNTTTTLDGYTFTYDYDNRLTNSGASVTIVYGADGNRIKKTVSGAVTLYLVAQVNPTTYPQVVEELTVSGGTTNLNKMYTYGLDLISQKQVSGSVISFFGYDGLGSVRFLTGTNGAVSDTYVYEGYGTQIASSGSGISNNYRFTGEQNDADLNMYYLRARYYKNGTGRFATMDTFEGRQADPLSLHKYLFTHASPVNYIDPSGYDDNAASQTVTAGGISYLASRLGYVVLKAMNLAARFPTATKVVLGAQTLITWWGVTQNPEEAALYYETGGFGADLALLKSIAKDIRGVVALYRGLNNAKQAQGIAAILTKSSIKGGTEVPRSGAHDPPGWNLLKDGERQRGHLLANSLGGQGDVPENVVTLYRSANREMENHELRVLSAVEAGEKVEYAVVPIYRENQSFPSAVALHAQGDKGFSLDITIQNQPK